MTWPITWPEYSDLDPVTGELVLRPAPVATDCADCGCAIDEGAPQAMVDRDVTCSHCAPEYDVATVRERRSAGGRSEEARVQDGAGAVTPG